MTRTLAALLGLSLAGCIQVVTPPPGPGASFGALLDAAIAAQAPPPKPEPWETVPPAPPGNGRY